MGKQMGYNTLNWVGKEHKNFPGHYWTLIYMEPPYLFSNWINILMEMRERDAHKYYRKIKRRYNR